MASSVGSWTPVVLRMGCALNFLKSAFTTGVLATYWLFALGGLFILVTLALPKGIVGTFDDWLKRRRAEPAHPAGALKPTAVER